MSDRSSEEMKGLEGWLLKTGEGSQFFGISREITPLMLADALRALGPKPPWWRPLRRSRWVRDFVATTQWWLTKVSLQVRA